MPRAKRKAPSRRPKPTFAEGDEGANLEEKQRKAKMAVLIEDFEAEVERRRNAMLDLHQQMVQKVEAIFNMELVRVPTDVRKMEVSEFLAAGGTIDAASMASAERLLAPMVSSIPNMMCKTDTLDSILEEDEKPSSAKSKKGKSKQNTRENMAPPSTARTGRRTKMTTPLHSGSLKATGWETPLITPKFDPRLPCTPAMLREAKPGERIMSMAGSPISNKAPAIPRTDVPIVTKVTTLLASDTDDLSQIAQEVNPTELDMMRSFQKKINAIIKLKRKK